MYRQVLTTYQLIITAVLARRSFPNSTTYNVSRFTRRHLLGTDRQQLRKSSGRAIVRLFTSAFKDGMRSLCVCINHDTYVGSWYLNRIKFRSSKLKSLRMDFKKLTKITNELNVEL